MLLEKASKTEQSKKCHNSSEQCKMCMPSLATWQKLLKIGWDVFPHPPYSPDQAPSCNYLVFQCLQNPLNGKTFNNYKHIKLFYIIKTEVQ